MITRAWASDQNLLTLRHSSRFGAVVTTQHRRIGAALSGQPIKLGDQVLAGDAAFDHSTQAFAGVSVDDRDDLDRPLVGGDIELEVHRLHPVGHIRDDRRRCGGGAVAFAASTLRLPVALPRAKGVGSSCD
jgi:hypothetical protein